MLRSSVPSQKVADPEGYFAAEERCLPRIAYLCMPRAAERTGQQRPEAMIRQHLFTLRPRRRGLHLVTDEIVANLPPLPRTGMLHLFLRHTSAGLTLTENADPDVRTDLERILDRLVPERCADYAHTLEGPDDMPAHAKATLTGCEMTIPIVDGRLGLGTWQGICLCEFRNRASGRSIVATVIGE